MKLIWQKLIIARVRFFTVFNALLVALFLLSIWAHSSVEGLTRAAPLPPEPKRIVSLAPSVTETLFSLGMGEHIVGVTRFCNYPPEVDGKVQVAGFSDVNYEAVLRVRPDLIALPQDKVDVRKNLESLGLAVLPVDTRSMSGLIDTVSILGQTTGHKAEADEILAKINASLAAARLRAKGRTPPKVLFSVMHSYQGLGYITELNVVGKDGFYSEMIKAAGGVNVYDGHLPFPRLSREAVVILNPDVIIDVIPEYEDLAGVRRDWQSMTSVNAIKNNRLYLFTDRADTVPGPRFYQTLTKLSLAFYPETLAEGV